MKAEDFFRLSMDQLFEVDKSTVDRYFKKFKKEFSKLPIVVNSLQNEVTDRDGNVLDINDINQDIKKIKNHFQNLTPEFLYSSFYWLSSWLDLFLHEIDLQVDFAKESFTEYQEQKKCKPLDTKRTFKNIHHFSIHVANISKLLEKLKMPANSLRSQLLSPLVEKIDLDLLSLRALRNHLEHFEERLESWHYLHSGKPLLDMNIISSSTKGLNIKNCLRVLDFEKDIIYILGEKFDLKNLFEAVVRIEKILKNKENLFG